VQRTNEFIEFSFSEQLRETKCSLTIVSNGTGFAIRLPAMLSEGSSASRIQGSGTSESVGLMKTTPRRKTRAIQKTTSFCESRMSGEQRTNHSPDAHSITRPRMAVKIGSEIREFT
jgi:hypothetical protein